MVHRRKTTRGLDTNQVKELNGGWHHARKLSLPLNVMISVRPIDINDLTPQQRCDLFASLRNKLGGYARKKGFPPTFAWSREINKDGTGEHMHVLMHVPRRHRRHFGDLLIEWHPGPSEMDVRDATQRVHFDYEGRRLSAIDYICKQMTPQAWYGRGMIRKAGGAILGKRGGVTANIDWKARQAYRNAIEATPALRPIPVETVSPQPFAAIDRKAG